MSALGHAIVYSASNRVSFLSKVARAQMSGVFQQHPWIGKPTSGKHSSNPVLRVQGNKS